MFGKLAQMGQMMAKAKEIKAGMEKMKAELPTMEFSASSANGRVKVTVSGDLTIKSIEIAPTTDVAMLSNEITEKGKLSKGTTHHHNCTMYGSVFCNPAPLRFNKTYLPIAI